MKKKPLELSSKSNRIFNKVYFLWIFSTILLVYLVNIFQLNVNSCVFCEYISHLIPAIRKWPLHTVFHNEAKILWLFLPFSSVVVLIYLLIKIKDVNNDKIPNKVKLFLGVCFLFGMFFSLFGLEYHESSDKSGGVLTFLFEKTLYGLAFFSTAMWGTMVLCLFYFISWCR